MTKERVKPTLSQLAEGVKLYLTYLRSTPAYEDEHLQTFYVWSDMYDMDAGFMVRQVATNIFNNDGCIDWGNS